MPGMPRGRSGRRWRSWRRKAVLFQRAALGCYVAAVVLAGLVFVWPWSAWLAVAVLLAGLWCQREATFARRLGDDTQDEADVPGD
jgi:hypothetical protein